MKVNVDKAKATELLTKLIADLETAENEPTSIIDDEIKAILNGTHLTYRYIFVNAILAKATDANVNPLALQKKSRLKGSFDARTLCHNVLVPFEREYLFNALGGSNEPFLNKPARFKELSADNAVRRGSDKETLETVIYALEKLDSEEDAIDALKTSLYILVEKANSLKSERKRLAKRSVSKVELIRVLHELLEQSMEGETLALVVGTLFMMESRLMSNEIDVLIHPVNQAGTSSNEIGDIDLLFDEVVFLGVEAKDKEFSQHDVMHAARKCSENDVTQLLFIGGLHSNIGTFDQTEAINQADNMNVNLYFAHVYDYIEFMLSKIRQEDINSFYSIANNILHDSRMKETTKSHFYEIMKNHKII